MVLKSRMPWTFEQRMDRISASLIHRGILDDSQVETIRRPLYFGRYSYSVGLSLKISKWSDWFLIKDQLQSFAEQFDCMLHSNSRIYQINMFSSDPKILRELMKFSWFTFNHIRIVDRNCWNLTLPRPKPKGKFYGEYGWRFEFKDPKWGLDQTNVRELEKLSDHIKLVTSPRTFLYIKKLSDVLMFKLIASEQLLALDDRSDL